MKGAPWKYGENCYPMAKRERMTGIVVVNFERSEFFLGEPRFTPAMREYTDGTWLQWPDTIPKDVEPDMSRPRAFLITFDGRRSVCPKPPGEYNGYGHMRGYRELAVVDRLISVEQVARLPSPFGSKE